MYVQDDDFGVGSTQRLNNNNNQKNEATSLPLQNSNETTRDYTGAGTLGDIMSRNNDRFSGLVTSEGGLLVEHFGVTSPLDRMALTANGNLQRLFSSFYDSPVHVVVDQSRQREAINGPATNRWDRVVHLTVHNQTFCTATSRITVHDKDCQAAVQSGRVGLGQLFRHLDRLPSFSLLEAGYSDSGGLWRIYQLDCQEVSCWIREDFSPRAWEIPPLH